MEQKKIQRINELAKKAKNEGLTSEEKEEQGILRREYIDALKNNLLLTLESAFPDRVPGKSEAEGNENRN